jgi:hypothetical protein
MKIFCLFFILSILSFNTLAQGFEKCDIEAYKANALSYLPKGFTLSKSYNVDSRICRKINEGILTLHKNVDYVIRLATKDGGFYGMIVTLYNAKREELMTSIVDNKQFNGWTYRCKQTGIYYISFTFKDSQSHCGGAVLGFRRRK